MALGLIRCMNFRRLVQPRVAGKEGGCRPLGGSLLPLVKHNTTLRSLALVGKALALSQQAAHSP